MISATIEETRQTAKRLTVETLDKDITFDSNNFFRFLSSSTPKSLLFYSSIEYAVHFTFLALILIFFISVVGNHRSARSLLPGRTAF